MNRRSFLTTTLTGLLALTGSVALVDAPAEAQQKVAPKGAVKKGKRKPNSKKKKKRRSRRRILLKLIVGV